MKKSVRMILMSVFLLGMVISGVQIVKYYREEDQSESLNRELISNISHDLKTPITAIKGYVEGLIDGVADTPEKQNKYLHDFS